MITKTKQKPQVHNKVCDTFAVLQCMHRAGFVKLSATADPCTN